MGSSIEHQGKSTEGNQSEKQRKKAIATIYDTIDQTTIEMNTVDNRPFLSRGVVKADGLRFRFTAYNRSNRLPMEEANWSIYVPTPAPESVSGATSEEELAEILAPYASFTERYQKDEEFRGVFTEAVRRALSEKEKQLTTEKLKKQ